MEQVGVYIPCFNAEKTILECLCAVLGQTYRIKEIVVIDDGSMDATSKLVSTYPVRQVKHSKNKGLAAARNNGIKNINAEFVASLDADCVPEKDWLERLMKQFSSSRISGAGGKLVERNKVSAFDLWRSVHMKQDWGEEKINPPFLFGSNTVFRKAAIEKAGLYNESWASNYEDVDLCKRLKKEKCGFVYDPCAVVHHLKQDDMGSLFNSYWKWNFGYYLGKGYYSSHKKLSFKIKDNIGLANRYLNEDARSKRDSLLYLDFLLSVHHSLRDFEYFIIREFNLSTVHKASDKLSCWLSMLDLVFFSRLLSHKKELPTLIKKSDMFLQNYFVLILAIGKIIKNKFKDDSFEKVLHMHLLQSILGAEDKLLLEKTLSLVHSRFDWRYLVKKKQRNLNNLFIEKTCFYFERWLDYLSRYSSKRLDLIKKFAVQ